MLRIFPPPFFLRLKYLGVFSLLMTCGLKASAQNTFPASGNAGIGTTSPAAKLQIHGSYSTNNCSAYSGQPALSIRWGIPATACVAYPGPTGTPPHAFQIYSNSGTLGEVDYPMFIVNANGLVSIGRELSLAHRFAVSGASLLEGNTSIKGNLDISSTLPNVGNLSVSRNGTFGGTLGVTGNSTLSGTLGVTGITTLSNALSVSGATSLNNTLGVGGATTLSNTLTVNGAAAFRGDISMSRTTDNAIRKIQGYSAAQGLEISANTGSFDGPNIEMYGKDYGLYPERKGYISFCSYGSTGQGISFNNFDPATSNWRRTMTVTNDNRVYIGNYKPSGNYADYKLGVDGSIVCKKAVVQNSSWADFVFAPDYRLPELGEVERFIQINGHLPGIPTEAEVLKNGVDVGEMNKLLLQKVEELTLYVIELKKETEALKAKVK